MHARRCVTFESPGLIKFWRKKARDHDEDYWRERIVNYLTYPSAPGAASPGLPPPCRRPVCSAFPLGGLHARVLRCRASASRSRAAPQRALHVSAAERCRAAQTRSTPRCPRWGGSCASSWTSTPSAPPRRSQHALRQRLFCSACPAPCNETTRAAASAGGSP